MPDKTVVSCPHCGKSFRAPVEYLGKRAKCKGCGEPFKLAAAAPDEEEGEYDLSDDSLEKLAVLGAGTAVEAGASPRGSQKSSTSAERFARAAERQAASRPAKASAKKAGSSWFGGAGSKVGVSLVALLFVAKVGVKIYNGLNHDRPTAQGSSYTPPTPRSAPPTFAASAPSASAGQPPTMRFSKVGRNRVGTVTAAMRSQRTVVKLVLPPGEHAARSLPCVFVCPAGSTLLTGVPWGEGEREDFYPLLDRGVAVCFYSLDGEVEDLQSASELKGAMAMAAYARAKGGVSNFQDAVDTALAAEKAIDPARLGAIGHSSAGTIALAAAHADPRIKAVAAMAPELDLPARFGPELMGKLPSGELGRLPYDLSALLWPSLPCEVFIVQAADDENVPARESQQLAAKHPGKVRLKVLPSGGHGGAYEEGLVPCFEFLAKQL